MKEYNETENKKNAKFSDSVWPCEKIEFYVNISAKAQVNDSCTLLQSYDECLTKLWKVIYWRIPGLLAGRTTRDTDQFPSAFNVFIFLKK